VAVAAAYAMTRYRETIKRVAIVDFDVHHGNGTQEIVELLAGPKKFGPSRTELAPWQTAEVSQSHYKPWFSVKDAENVLFTSVHLYSTSESIWDSDSDFYSPDSEGQG